MKHRNLVLAASLLVLAIPANADRYSPSHACFKPHKPYQFDYEWQIEDFRNEVKAYKKCLVYFVEDQKAAITRHQHAAEDAVEDWNSFVDLYL